MHVCTSIGKFLRSIGQESVNVNLKKFKAIILKKNYDILWMLYCSGYNCKAKLLSVVTNVYSNKICSKLAVLCPETAIPLYINLILGEGRRAVYLNIQSLIFIYPFFPFRDGYRHLKEVFISRRDLQNRNLRVRAIKWTPNAKEYTSPKSHGAYLRRQVYPGNWSSKRGKLERREAILCDHSLSSL